MTLSPPPTPRLDFQHRNFNHWRFHEIGLPCEWVEHYRPGGFHPVELGDVFKDGRYKVIRKLGDGSASTVWLAHDTQSNTYVALKILKSKFSQSNTELEVTRRILSSYPSEGRSHFVEPLDDFFHQGPNGNHRCICFEPMGPDVNHVLDELFLCDARKKGMSARFPTLWAKRILKQTLLALELLHRQGIAKGDLQPGNILFVLSDINGLPLEKLEQRTTGKKGGPRTAVVERRDGKQDKWAPKRLHLDQPLFDFTPIDDSCKVKLSDMGGAYFFTDPPAEMITPMGLRAPELVLTGTVNPSLDIWSFGCLIFELFTGRPLCYIFGPDYHDDEHILALIGSLGPLPDFLFKDWKTSSLYYTSEGKLYNSLTGGAKEGEGPWLDLEPSMEETFDEAKSELDADEAATVKALIRRILRYDPAERPTAAELLQDPWFRGIDA